MRKLLAAFVALVLAGCATPYQSGTYSFTGGFYQSPEVGHLEKIAFSGNGFISPQKIEQYTLYRCAEVAKSKNKSHFMLYGSLIEASVGKSADRPTVGSVGGKPTGFAFVLFLDTVEPGSKETDVVLKELEPVIKASQPADKS